VAVGAGILFGTEILFAGTHWIPAKAEVDEVVADTTMTVPPHPRVQPLGTPIPFHNFRYPHVSAAEDVTFIANDQDFRRHGIYRSFAATHELKPLVVTGLAMDDSGDAQFQYISGLQMDGDDLVFTAHNGRGASGVFLWSKEKITTVARTGRTVLPGHSSPLVDVNYGALRNGRMIYQAKDSDGTFLVLYDVKARAHRVLARTGIPIPGRKDEQFRYFSPQNWIDENNIIFRAARVVEPHRSLGRPWEWYENFRAARESKPQIFAKEAPANVGIYGWFGIDWSNPNALDVTNLLTVADWSTTTPETGGKFVYFGSAPIARDLLAFMSEVSRPSGGSVGVYCALLRPNAAPQFRNIVDTDTEIESLFDGTFTGFNKWVGVADGSVFFIGNAKGYTGVFLYKPKLDALFLLCDNREPIDGKAVSSFEVGSNFLVRNRFAITVHFHDGSAGVYLATIPPHSFKRMLAAQ
jgi:hypothetical protein